MTLGFCAAFDIGSGRFKNALMLGYDPGKHPCPDKKQKIEQKLPHRLYQYKRFHKSQDEIHGQKAQAVNQ